MANSCKKAWILLNLLEFTWIYSNLRFLRNAWRTHGPTHRRTDQRTKPLIDLLFATKKSQIVSYMHKTMRLRQHRGFYSDICLNADADWVTLSVGPLVGRAVGWSIPRPRCSTSSQNLQKAERETEREGATQIFKKILEFLKKNGSGTSYVSYFDCDSDSIISMPFLLEFRGLKKMHCGPTDWRTDRRTDLHIEMRGCI